MTKPQLSKLHRLLSIWIAEPEWNRASDEWAAIVEARRQVEIDLRQFDPDWRPDD